MRARFVLALIATVAFTVAVSASNPPQGSGGGGWVGTATGDLDMALNEITFGSGADTFIGRSAAGTVYVGATTGTADGTLAVSTIVGNSSNLVLQPVSGTTTLGLTTNNTQFSSKPVSFYTLADLQIESDVEIQFSSGLPTGTRDTFLSRDSAGTLQVGTTTFAEDGSLKLALLDTTAGTTATQLAMGAGSLSTPVITFGDADTGIYAITPSRIGFAVNAGLIAEFTGVYFHLFDERSISLGSSNDAVIGWTTGQTNDGLMIGLSTGSSAYGGYMAIVESSNRTGDYGHAAQTDPAIFVHSAAAAGTATDEWVGIQHDGTNGVFSLGSGGYDFSGGQILADAAVDTIELGTGGPTIGVGSGTPESVVTADIGSTFHRTDGGSGTSFYVKESGTGNTGWVAK